VKQHIIGGILISLWKIAVTKPNNC